MRTTFAKKKDYDVGTFGLHTISAAAQRVMIKYLGQQGYYITLQNSRCKTEWFAEISHAYTCKVIAEVYASTINELSDRLIGFATAEILNGNFTPDHSITR